MTPKLTKAQEALLIKLQSVQHPQLVGRENPVTVYRLVAKGLATWNYDLLAKRLMITNAGRKVCEGLKK